MKTLVLLGMVCGIFSVQAIAGEAGYITNGKKTVVWVGSVPASSIASRIAEITPDFL